MHQALLIDEILRHMVAFSDNAELAVLARTCRIFQDPALDRLWSVLYSPAPLLRLLPAVSEDVDNSQVGTII
jgi:hypothetical protein